MMNKNFKKKILPADCLHMLLICLVGDVSKMVCEAHQCWD